MLRGTTIAVCYVDAGRYVFITTEPKYINRAAETRRFSLWLAAAAEWQQGGR